MRVAMSSGRLQRAREGKEQSMTRLILTMLSIGLFAAAVTGCKASADVDPHGSSSINSFNK
jgi:hypothetical protein